MSDFFSKLAASVESGETRVTGTAAYLSKRTPADFECTLVSLSYGPSSDPKKKGVSQLIIVMAPTLIRKGETGRDDTAQPLSVGEEVTMYLALDSKNELAAPKQAVEAIDLIAGLTGARTRDLIAQMATLGAYVTDASANLVGKPYLVTSKPANNGWYNPRIERLDA